MKQLLLGAAAMLFAGAAYAQNANQADTMSKLMDMHVAGTPADMEVIPQGGAKAEQLRANLKNIRLPDGFKISLYAIVPDARHMAVANNTPVVFVGTRKQKVWSVSDRSQLRVADEVKIFAPAIKFALPNGVCISKDGFLFIAEQNRVLVFPAAEFFYESPDVAVGVIAETLIPKAEESYNHTARVCRIGPDNKLYITLGQPYNVPPHEKMALYNEVGIGGIVRMDREGGNREVFARGVRKPGADLSQQQRAPRAQAGAACGWEVVKV
jgi:glucose/arabinose dehydrogenase